MTRLIKPCIEYWQDYLRFIRECQAAGDEITAQKSAATALKAFDALDTGRGLPAGVVQCSHYWLISGAALVGIGAARHWINDSLEKNGGHIDWLVKPALRGRGWEAKLLSLLIKECGRHGIKCAMITHLESDRIASDAANRSGARVIDRDGPSGAVVVRRLADTKLRISPWREPMFKFKQISRIYGDNVDLELSGFVEASREFCPSYQFDIVEAGTKNKIGHTDLRIGFDHEIFTSGNIGYSIYEQYRGHGYAREASFMLAPLALAHHMRQVTITCNPDNAASAKTAEKLGAKYLEYIKLPKDSKMYQQGDRVKRRYVWNVAFH